MGQQMKNKSLFGLTRIREIWSIVRKVSTPWEEGHFYQWSSINNRSFNRFLSIVLAISLRLHLKLLLVAFLRSFVLSLWILELFESFSIEIIFVENLSIQKNLLTYKFIICVNYLNFPLSRKMKRIFNFT